MKGIARFINLLSIRGESMDDLANPKDALIQVLRKIIRFGVRCLAALMTLVILWGVVDVAWVIYLKIITPPIMMMTISDMLASFGAFMAVLIAIEIFINITIYLRDDVIHVKIVMATALMAIARKVIILDIDTMETDYMWAVAAIVLSMSIGYYLVVKHTAGTTVECEPLETSSQSPFGSTIVERETKKKE